MPRRQGTPPATAPRHLGQRDHQQERGDGRERHGQAEDRRRHADYSRASRRLGIPRPPESGEYLPITEDAFFCAGSITRPGTNSEFHLVDERIVGNKPKSLTFAEAAALPLTSITAWEALFDRMANFRNGSDDGKSLLVLGGAGGVGSIAIQVAKQVARLNVIATASRDESRAWCPELGADHVVNHREDWNLASSGRFT